MKIRSSEGSNYQYVCTFNFQLNQTHMYDQIMLKIIIKFHREKALPLCFVGKGKEKIWNY
jgi:hypothetical protein